MPPVVFFGDRQHQQRDLALDQNLESEARLTLILVAAGLGVLVLATVVIFFGYRLLGFFRFPFFSLSKATATTPTADIAEAQLEKPETASVASTDLAMPSNQSHRTEGSTPNTPKSKIPFFFSPLRKHSSAPHRPAGVYAGFGRSPFQVARPSATTGVSYDGSQSSQSHSYTISSHMESPHTQTAFYAPHGIVTPHAAGWMKIADSVVGRHPDAKPLHARVATQGDIDLISGHVHMPWAYNDDHHGRTQPIPVKVFRPDIVLPPPVFQGPQQPAPEVLKDVRNTRERAVLISVDNGSNGKKSGKRAQKKSPRSTFEKENMPIPPPSASIPVSYGRRPRT